VQSTQEPPYTVVDTHAGGGINGGIGTVQEGTAPYMTMYAQTPDIKASFDRAVALGAEVLIPVSDVPGIVTLCLLRDPQGNPFGMVTPGEGPGVSSGDGVPVDWFEIIGPDPKALRDFYVELFGWERFGDDATGDYEYYQVHTGEGGLDGGIGSSPTGIRISRSMQRSTTCRSTSSVRRRSAAARPCRRPRWRTSRSRSSATRWATSSACTGEPSAAPRVQIPGAPATGPSRGGERGDLGC